MEAIDMVVNHLPAPTWEHLRMNRTPVAQVALRSPGNITVSGGLTWSEAGDPQRFAGIETGSGPDVDRLLDGAGIAPRALVSPSGSRPEAVRLTFDYNDGAADGSLVLLEAEENSVLTVLMDFAAPQRSAGLAAVQTRIRAHTGAVVRLVQVQRLGKDFTFFNDIGALCDENARVELVQLVLSGEKSYLGCHAALSGNGSGLSADIGYALARRESLDMNYVARHIGKQTVSAINANGSLRCRASKLFRGTIDFLNGSAGSVGNEKEEVLLIDEDTVNQTIPLILCAEEDVEGNHGASIGKPDEDVLFYLAARGIPQDAAYDLLARAKLDAVAGLICDPDFRQETLNHIKGGEADE